jgi:hypothetical protein
VRDAAGRFSTPRPPPGKLALSITGVSSIAADLHKFLNEAKIAIEVWRRQYITAWPPSSRGYRAPAPEALVWPATTMVAEMPALNYHSNRTTQWGPVRLVT